MQNDDIVFGGKRDKLMIKAIRRQNRRGVVGIGYHHQLGLLGYGRGDLVQIDEIPVFRTLRHRIQRGARQARPIGKDGVAGIWHEDNVAWVYDGKQRYGTRPSWEPKSETISEAGSSVTP